MTKRDNSRLTNAKKGKNDEFYTQLTDIEKELRYYRKYFKGKTILCNCDDPFESNFFKYFVLNFNRLGLKKLMATCYATSSISNQELSLSKVMFYYIIFSAYFQWFLSNCMKKSVDIIHTFSSEF